MSTDQPVLRCSACGAPVHPGAPTCSFCGAQLVAPSGASMPRQSSAQASDAIEALRGRVARIGGAAEQQYAYAGPQECAQLAQKLNARVLAVSNEVLLREGRHVRVNYIHAASPADLQAVFQSMVALVGKTNAVARKGDVVVEIISGDSRDVKEVLETLQVDEVHRTHHRLW